MTLYKSIPTSSTFKYQNVLFDFDGTIVDTSEGIINCLTSAYQDLKISYDSSNLKSYVGLPLTEIIKKSAYNLDEKGISEIVKIFRQKYSEYGVFQYQFYPEIIDLFKFLFENKIKLFIVSLKPRHYIIEILKNNNLLDLFTNIKGAGDDNLVADKNILIKEVVNERESFVMIGDHYNDILAGQSASIDTIAVTYGFSKEDILKRYSPTYLINKVEEILDIIINKN